MTLNGLKNILEKEGLTFIDFVTILYYYEGVNRSKMINSTIKLKKMKYLHTGENFSVVVPDNTEKVIDGWLDNNTYIRNEKERYLELATKLQELYPKGRKPGTNYMWRDSTVTIAKKLHTLSDKFQVQFTDEEAIEATKKYVDSFNGNYTFMQLLKYFILKRDLAKQEETSQLLSFIENKDTVAVMNYDSGELI